MGSNISFPKKLKNKLQQGSVLAPLLFNLYIADMPEKRLRKFVKADDWVLAIRCKSIEESEEISTDDLEKMVKYFRKWRFQPNANKAEVYYFHLNNKIPRRELNVQFENTRLTHIKILK